MPAGFWKSYEDDLIVESFSDQGPWGGERSLYWQSATPNQFKIESILDYATENGWTLVDSKQISQNEILNWVALDNKPIVQLRLGPFDSPSQDLFYVHELPRWTETESTLYKFKTDWLRFYSGTDYSTEETGFILLANNGTEMSVYHIWGE